MKRILSFSKLHTIIEFVEFFIVLSLRTKFMILLYFQSSETHMIYKKYSEFLQKYQ